MEAEPRYRVGELAHICGVNPRTVDYYTTCGLISPAGRSRGGHRFYGEEAARRLSAIKLLQAQGLTLEEIRARLDELTEADLLPRLEHLRAELRRLESEVAEIGPRLAAPGPSDNATTKALQATVAGAAAYALSLAQELVELLSNSNLGHI